MSPTGNEELVLFALMSIWFGNKLAKELIKPREKKLAMLPYKYIFPGKLTIYFAMIQMEITAEGRRHKAERSICSFSFFGFFAFACLVIYVIFIWL